MSFYDVLVSKKKKKVMMDFRVQTLHLSTWPQYTTHYLVMDSAERFQRKGIRSQLHTERHTACNEFPLLNIHIDIHIEKLAWQNCSLSAEPGLLHMQQEQVGWDHKRSLKQVEWKTNNVKNICFLINKYRYVIIIHIVKVCKHDVTKLKRTFSAEKLCTVELKSSSFVYICAT